MDESGSCIPYEILWYFDDTNGTKQAGVMIPVIFALFSSVML